MTNVNINIDLIKSNQCQELSAMALCVCECVLIGLFFLPGTDSRCCHYCGSHLLKVHLIWTLEVSDDATCSPQWDHNNINVPAGAEEDNKDTSHMDTMANLSNLLR